MVKVTYGIRFSKTSPLAQEIKLQKTKLKKYVVQNNTRQACKIALVIADLLLSQADYIDTDLPMADQERDMIDHANEALKYCQKSNPVFISNEDYKHLARSYLLMVRCYQRLDNYNDAITIGNDLVGLFKQPQPKVKDITLLQESYKLLADLYFTHGLLGNHISKQTDLPLALKYYEKERKVLNTIKTDTLKGDDLINYTDNIRCSDFNLGVIKAKLMHSSRSSSWPDGETAEDHLKMAIKGSIDLDNVDQERKTWWELGNLYNKRGQLDEALDCQMKELNLVRKHHLGDKMGTMIDVLKTLVQMEDYSGCMELCRQLRSHVMHTYRGDELDTQNDFVQELVDMVLMTQARRLELDDLIKIAKEEHFDHNKKNNIDIHTGYYDFDKPRIRNAVIGRKMRRQIATVSLSLAQLYHDTGLLASSQKVVDDGLSYVVDADTDDSNMVQDVSLPLMRLRIQLVQLKAENHWQLHDCPMEELIKMNHSIIELVTMYIQNQQEQLEFLLPAQIRTRDIYHYYDHTQETRQWRRAARNTEKRLNLMTGVQPLEIDEEDEIMHNNSTTEDEEDMDINQGTVMDVPKPLSLHPKPIFGTNPTPAKMAVTVALNLPNGHKTMVIVCDDDLDTLDWLDEQVTKRSWELYGLEPIISHFRHDDDDLFPDDTLSTLARGSEIMLDAVIKGYKDKSLLDLYENSCSRLEKSPSPQMQRALKDKPSDTTHLSLRGTGLSSDEMDVIIDLVQILPLPLTSMDLSANLLRDDDITKLYDAVPCPPKLNLNSNLLTFGTLEYLYTSHGSSLESVEIAYNFLGTDLPHRMKDVHQACPKLRHWNIDGSDIDNHQEKYKTVSTRSSSQSPLPSRTPSIIDLSN